MKLILSDVASGYNLQNINENFTKISEEFQSKVLYRDNPVGEPNQLAGSIDANGHTIYNLAVPSAPSHAARLKDVQNAIAGIPTANLVLFEPTATISSTNVQGAIEEVAASTTALVGKSIQAVTSVSALRSLLKTGSSKIAHVSGYYTSGDGGAGVYYLDSADTSTLDNAGTVIVASDGGRWKLSGVPSVNNFGAKGNGTFYDGAAFIAMAAATGGRINLLVAEYNVNGLSLVGDSISIIGLRTPSAKLDDTKLQNGSILIGSVTVTANEGYYTKFGIDSGSARGLGVVDGFVSNAASGQTGTKVYCHDVASLGASEANPTHGILLQGYNSNDIDGNYASKHQFGVVVKGRHGNVTNTRTRFIKTAGVYIKSDVGASAGNVGDGLVTHINVVGVANESSPSNTECNAVYVHASTGTLSSVTVDGVHTEFGNSGVRIAGGSDPSLAATNCIVTNITAEKAAMAVELFGFNYETQLSNIIAINPTTGKAVSTSGNSTNYIATNMTVVIADASILSTECAAFYGSGVWDNFSVRNPYRVMSITQAMPAIVAGAIRGDVKIAGEGNLTLLNSATSGARVPRARILPGNHIVLTGWVVVSASTSTTIANLAFDSIDERFFTCAARKADNSYTTVVIYMAGTVLISMTDLTGLTYIDVSSIAFKLS